MFFDIDTFTTLENKTFNRDPLGVLKTIISELYKLGRKHPELVAGLSAMTDQSVFEEVLSASDRFKDHGFKLVTHEGVNAIDMGEADLFWSPCCPCRSVIFVSRPRNGFIQFSALLARKEKP